MANIGEQLLQPEEGMKRIDDTFYAIKYNSNVITNTGAESRYYYNNSYTVADEVEFYIYSSKLILIFDLWYKNRLEHIDVYIDDEFIETVSQYNKADIGYGVYFKKVDMKKKVHKITLKKQASDTTSNSIGFDAIDIDEDGYMLYCDDNGKLYYDVTPIMTSNNTPSPYVVSSSSVYNNSYYPYKAFDGRIDTNSIVVGSTGQWVKIDFGEKILSNYVLIKIKSSTYGFELYGSNDDNVYDLLINNEYNKLQQISGFYNIGKSSYRYYKIIYKQNNGESGTALSNLRFLLAVDTPRFLIKDNSTDKIYNYDKDSNSLVEVSDISILNEDTMRNTCIDDLNKVKDLIDLKSNGVKVISNKNIKAKTKVLKSTKQMIIGSGDFSTRLADNIDYFKFQYNISDENCVIKTVISIDSGKTWKSYINGNWECLENSVTIKDYSDLTELEKNNWNNLLDEILTKGINIKDINETLDFNSLDMEKCRFAYAIQVANPDSVVLLKDLKWQFDSIGSYEQLSPKTDVNISITNEAIKIQPLKNMELIKINVSTPSQFSQPQKENEILNKFNINDNNKLTWNNSILYTEEDINALNIKATNIIVNIKNGDNEETKTLQEVLNDILANGIQSQQTRAVCGTAICGTTTCGDL